MLLRSLVLPMAPEVSTQYTAFLSVVLASASLHYSLAPMTATETTIVRAATSPSQPATRAFQEAAFELTVFAVGWTLRLQYVRLSESFGFIAVLVVLDHPWAQDSRGGGCEMWGVPLIGVCR